MLYVTSYLLILTEQGPFFTPRNPSCYVHFIFPPPDHSLNPPSHRAGQSRASPVSLHHLAAGCQTDRPTQASSQGNGTTCATQGHPHARPCCPGELKGGGWAHQLPASGTGIPPTHCAPSHEGRQPKGIPLLPPFSHAGGAHLSHLLAPSSPQRVCNSQPRRGTVDDGGGEGCCRPAVQGDGQPRAALAAAISPATLPGE